MQKLSLFQKWIMFGLLSAILLLTGALIWTTMAGDPEEPPGPVETGPAGITASPLPTEAATAEPTPIPATDSPPPTPSPGPTPSPVPGVPQNPPAAAPGEHQRIVALTFDDGPDVATTRLLDALRERNVQATFFVIGKHIQRYPEILIRTAGEGHEIGNHTMSHKFFSNISMDTMRKEVSDCSDLIEELIGVRPTLFRAPGGDISSKHFPELERLGLASIFWWVDPQDWRHVGNKEAILAAAFCEDDSNYRIRDGAIILLHDIYESSVDAAIAMMDKLIADGYRIVTVTELLDTRKGGVTPGKHYLEGFPG